MSIQMGETHYVSMIELGRIVDAIGYVVIQGLIGCPDQELE